MKGKRTNRQRSSKWSDQRLPLKLDKRREGGRGRKGVSRNLAISKREKNRLNLGGFAAVKGRQGDLGHRKELDGFRGDAGKGKRWLKGEADKRGRILQH